MSRHLVTGAGSGIGAALARRLHARGDDLVLVARSTSRADNLRTDFPDATVLVADLADPAAVEALGGSLPESLESVVHCAGVVELGAVAELSAAHWAETLAANLVAPAVLTRIALPALRQGRGTVVFVNSGAGLAAHAGWSAYAASKHGLKALADALRAEEAAVGVRVTSLYPGRTATPMQEKVRAQEGLDYDAADWSAPQSVADTVVHILDLPDDSVLTDVTLRPRH